MIEIEEYNMLFDLEDIFTVLQAVSDIDRFTPEYEPSELEVLLGELTDESSNA